MDDLIHELHIIEHLMHEGEMSRAISLLEDLSKNYPDHYLVISMLGEAYLYAGKPEKAIKPLEWATKTFSSEEHEEEQGAIEEEPKEVQKNDPEAVSIRTLKKMFYQRDNSPWYDHFLLGCAYGRTMKLQRAIKHLKAADHLHPNNTEILRNLGWIYCMQEQNEFGRKLLKKAIDLDPTNALAYNDFGASLMFDHKLEEAKSWIEKALLLAPDDPFIQNTAEKLEDMIALRLISKKKEQLQNNK